MIRQCCATLFLLCKLCVSNNIFYKLNRIGLIYFEGYFLVQMHEKNDGDVVYAELYARVARYMFEFMRNIRFVILKQSRKNERTKRKNR